MSACLDCEKRHVGCHGSCDDYKKYKQELEEKTALKREMKHKEVIVRDTLFISARKRYVKYKQKKW